MAGHTNSFQRHHLAYCLGRGISYSWSSQRIIRSLKQSTTGRLLNIRFGCLMTVWLPLWVSISERLGCLSLQMKQLNLPWMAIMKLYGFRGTTILKNMTTPIQTFRIKERYKSSYQSNASQGLFQKQEFKRPYDEVTRGSLHQLTWSSFDRLSCHAFKPKPGNHDICLLADSGCLGQ